MLNITGRHVITIRQEYLEYTDDSSNKFYRTLVIADATTDTGTLICQWGVIGTKGQEKVIHYKRYQSAFNEASKKTNEKNRKGYVHQLDRSPMKIGTPGHLSDRTYGKPDNEAKDKEADEAIKKEIGSLLFEAIVSEHGWNSYTDEEIKTAQLEREFAAERSQIERSAAYGSEFGAWA
jgi:predicted DNA-binding WGR domain protein